MANENLHKAKEAKNDEFYTQLNDVSEELRHYKEHFKDKIIFCNCDDPTWSAFWRYFHLNFDHLGLKKLISTHYDKEKPTYKMEYTGGNDNDIEAGVKTPLEGNGDFRNQECIDLLKEADIVVTNPPFSIAREDFIPQLFEYCNGIFGVPITFLDKYNSAQFEIIGATESEGKGFSNGLWFAESGIAQPLINKQRKYKRLFARKIL